MHRAPDLLEVRCKEIPSQKSSEFLGCSRVLLPQSQLSVPMKDGIETRRSSLKSQPTQWKEAPAGPCCHCSHSNARTLAPDPSTRPLQPESVSSEHPHSTALGCWLSHPGLLALPRLFPAPSRKEGPSQVRKRSCPTLVHPQPRMPVAVSRSPRSHLCVDLPFPCTHLSYTAFSKKDYGYCQGSG